MGKPFANEIKLLLETSCWANSLNISYLSELISKYRHPVYIVGSGGSFSACIYAADLLASNGIIAKAITPLELFYAKNTVKKSNLIFISASGRNNDIIFAFKKAIESEPISIINICMRENTKLTELASRYSSCCSFEFSPPAGKDGFLATNSLIAYFVILNKAIKNEFTGERLTDLPEAFFKDFIAKSTKNTCFTILYGSYNHAVAVDLESKFSEAGLAPSLISDYRHFAHGRHQWFDKKKDSAIIALTCESDEKLCSRTLALMPDAIPKIVLKSSSDDFEGTIDLLRQSMELIRLYGEKQGFDPGRPGVPDYGSEIYHLRYERLVTNKPITKENIAIIRKAKANSLSDINKEDYAIWKSYHKKFIRSIENAQFGSLIFDYDGTLCSAANRFTGMTDQIGSLLIDFVKAGFVIGIISGRGKSLRTDIEKVFEQHQELKKRVVLGYYNGSDIAPLSDTNHPDKSLPMHSSLKIVLNRMKSIGVKPDVSPNQLTFGSKTTTEWESLKETLLNELMLLNLSDITIVESSHSIDMIPRKLASKNNMLIHCQRLCTSLGLIENALCIGDKGQWPGNDYELLANQHALSVGEVSSNPNVGWNVCPVGIKDEKGVSYLFTKIKMEKTYFRLANI